MQHYSIICSFLLILRRLGHDSSHFEMNVLHDLGAVIIRRLWAMVRQDRTTKQRDKVTTHSQHTFFYH